MAPYCAIPRDYLSDTPLLRAMGFLVSQHGQLGAIPPPPFLSVSPLESMRSGGAIPPPQKGYLSDTCAIPYENKANGCDTPLCDTISKGYCAIRGGISCWAAKEPSIDQYQSREKLLMNFQGHWSIQIVPENKAPRDLSIWISLEIHIDQWFPNLCESSGLHQYRSIA